MAEKVQINFRVGSSQKGEWEDYLKESGRFNTLSDLIRYAVENEVNGEASPQSVESPAITSDIQEVKTNIEEIRDDVRWIRHRHLDDVAISDVAQEVFDTLEPLPDVSLSYTPDGVEDTQTFRRQEAARRVIQPTDEEDPGSPQTAQAIADRLDKHQVDVRKAIGHLQDQFLPVVAVELDGETHYFKEE